MSTTIPSRVMESANQPLDLGYASADAPDFIGHIVHQIENGYMNWAQAQYGDGVITSKVAPAVLRDIDAGRASVDGLLAIRRDQIADPEPVRG